MAGLGKQAKTLTRAQIEMVASYLRSKRNGLRNQTIFLLSARAGLRAKEISGLTWDMVITPTGEIDDSIYITNKASKGNSGRIIPIHPSIKSNLNQLIRYKTNSPFIITTERAEKANAQTIVNMFRDWYQKTGLIGCSSHSGRRTFITKAAQKISLVGGSLRDVQLLAGHSNLQTTQRYIECNNEAQRSVIKLL
jgi:integrase/recombinase XerD